MTVADDTAASAVAAAVEPVVLLLEVSLELLLLSNHLFLHSALLGCLGA